MTKMYYRNARGAIVCYDVTDAASFERAKYWVEQLRRAEEDVVISLVATKTDLLAGGAARGTPVSVVLKYARSIDAEHFETSSKSGASCDAPFLSVVERTARQGRSKVEAYDPGFRVRKEGPGAEGGSKPCPCK
jgi:Ras-related protein Rab-24